MMMCNSIPKLITHSQKSKIDASPSKWANFWSENNRDLFSLLHECGSKISWNIDNSDTVYNDDYLQIKSGKFCRVMLFLKDVSLTTILH